MSGDSWRDRAECKGTDPDVFYPENRGRDPYRHARRYCDVCHVVEECLEDALAYEWGTPVTVRAGMFGGETPEGRRAVERLRRDLDDLFSEVPS